jgi:cyanophycinase
MSYPIKIFFFLSINFVINAQGYICAIGGGSEDYGDWSDEPYSWIVQKSDSGKIIILGASSDVTTWLPNYFLSFGADTAYNKTISTTSIANLQSTYDELITAKAIFIRGGDQWDYVRLWKGTKTDTAIQYVFNNGGVVAGTSAGAAVLGDVDFSAKNGSAYSDDALQNPFYSRMQFESDFLNFVPNVLFDSHFIERGRLGRLISMLYNQHFSSGVDLIGAGIDDRTAICISPDGIGEVIGSGAVYIFYKDENTNYTNYEFAKYTIENLKSHILTKYWKFDFINNEISFIPESAKDVDVNRPWQYPQTSFNLTGNNNLTAQINNLSSFIQEVNSSNVLIVTHPGFNNSITTITDFLSSINCTFDILYLTNSNLNDAVDAGKINHATCFVFAGDSLNVLSYLNQPIGLVNAAFYNSLAQQTPVFFFGNSGKISGNTFIGNTDADLYAGYRGKMTLNEGLNVFDDLIFQPLIYDNEDYFENRTSSVLWGMMRSRKRIGIYLNGNDRLKINSSSSGNSINANVQIPYLIVDARETTKVDSSTYRASGSIGPRQIAAMNDLRISLTNYPQINYLIDQGKFDNLTSIELGKGDLLNPDGFQLYQNYPNPFNPGTTISFYLNKADKVTLKIFDALGKEIETLIDDYYESGNHTEFYILNSKLSSGVYFYRLSTNDFSITKSMVLLK